MYICIEFAHLQHNLLFVAFCSISICLLPFFQPPRFSFYDATKPIYTSRRNLPPSKIENSKVFCLPFSMMSQHSLVLWFLRRYQLTMHVLLQIVDSIVSHGSFLTDCFVEHSVVGIRSRINSNVHLKVHIEIIGYNNNRFFSNKS